MKNDYDHDSSEEEGFYKPKLKVVKEEEPKTPVKANPVEWQANSLVNHTRPTDYLPRTLSSLPQLVYSFFN